jgi:hypothetical protein
MIIVALLAALTLALPSQMIELYIIHSWRPEDDALGATIQLASGILALGLLGAALWAGTVRLLSLTDRAADAPAHRPRLRHEITAACIGLIPTLGLGVGFWRAFDRFTSDEVGASGSKLILPLLKPGAALAVLIVASTVIYALLLRRNGIGLVARIFSRAGVVAFVIALALFLAALWFQPVRVPGAIGTLAITAIFFAMIAYILTHFATLTERWKVPIVTPVVLFAVLNAWTGLSDNHRARSDISKEKLPELEQAFVDWYKARRDRANYEGKRPYPIYLVSAEGGGIYAAYNAASFLATLQDECPSFAQHVFAVSSVSGGSLGGAVFAALAQRRAQNAEFTPCGSAAPGRQTFRRFVDKYFETDFLSPLVAAMLFPDFLQRFIPFPIYAFDRARALEYAFEAAWASAASEVAAKSTDDGENPFAQPLGKVGTYDGAAPALFLHATSVALGSRITMSPLHFAPTATTNHISEALFGWCDESGQSVDTPLSTAVGLSARFPWVTPVGWLERPLVDGKPIKGCEDEEAPLGNRLYLADGGYFENSGLEQAIELAARLRRVIQLTPGEFPGGEKSAEIRIIQIAAKDRFATRWSRSDFGLTFNGGSEVTAPLDVLLSTRLARTRSVEDSTLSDGAYSSGPFRDPNKPVANIIQQTREHFLPGYHRVVVDGTKLFLPLGWHISRFTRDRIANSGSLLPKLARCMITAELMGEADENALTQMETCRLAAKRAMAPSQ